MGKGEGAWLWNDSRLDSSDAHSARHNLYSYAGFLLFGPLPVQFLI